MPAACICFRIAYYVLSFPVHMGSRKTYENIRDSHYEELELQETLAVTLMRKQLEATAEHIRKTFEDGSARYSE